MAATAAFCSAESPFAGDLAVAFVLESDVCANEKSRAGARWSADSRGNLATRHSIPSNRAINVALRFMSRSPGCGPINRMVMYQFVGFCVSVRQYSAFGVINNVAQIQSPNLPQGIRRYR